MGRESAVTKSRMLTIDDVAEQLQVSARTVFDYCTRGDLEYVKFNNKTLRFRQEWIDDMIARKQRKGA
jgi:predicted site-specific integrase-resolvase